MPHDPAAWVALRAKEGEAEALTHADESHLERVQPLMILDRATSVAGQLAHAERVARHLHNHDRVLAVDAWDVDPSAFRPTVTLGELVDRLSYGVDLFDVGPPIPILPTLRECTSLRDAADIGRLGEETGAGVALRIQLLAGRTVDIAGVVDALKVDPRTIDVVLDLGFVEAALAEHVDLVHAAVDVVRTTGPLRSIVLLSGSVPPQLSRLGRWHQDRHEEQLWQGISAQHADVLFGDYGVVHPTPTKGWRPRNVAVRYACPTGWTYWRRPIEEPDPAGADDGSGDEPPRARAFRELCRELVDTDVFAGPDFSWGDRKLSNAARGNEKTLGRASRPVAFATSHHLAHLATMDRAA